MLSSIIFASAPKPRAVGEGGLSGSQLFPCPHRLFKAHMGETIYTGNTEPRDMLNMEDGWAQESQTIQRLARGGVKIEDRQATVTVGRSNIKGHIDGTFTINNKKRLWEHKAWASNYFDAFASKGLDLYPAALAQVNFYMIGMALEECCFMVKKKENNDYHDVITYLDRPFIKEIIDWCDEIRLGGWEPKPEMCRYCANCGLDCFGPVLDFSPIINAAVPDMVSKYTKGWQMSKAGEFLMDEAKSFFIGKKDKYGHTLVEGIIGDKDVMLLEGLKIRKINSTRFDVSKSKILEEFGPDALIKVGEEKFSSYYRFDVEV